MNLAVRMEELVKDLVYVPACKDGLETDVILVIVEITYLCIHVHTLWFEAVPHHTIVVILFPYV